MRRRSKRTAPPDTAAGQSAERAVPSPPAPTKSVWWKYEPDEKPKKKHAWDRPHAGVVEHPRGTKIAKCPSNIATDLAEKVLNTGVPVSFKSWRDAHPQRIYAVHEGVLYRATPTNPGVPYHAFPEFPERFRELPAAARRAVLDYVKGLGYEDEVRRWMRT